MFWLTILWLGLIGVGLHLLADQPAPISSSNVAAAAVTPEADLELTANGRFHSAAVICLIAALALLPIYWLEWIAHRRSRETQTRVDWLPLVLPALRISGRDHVHGRTQWLPGLGWVSSTDDLEARLERQLSIPMLVVALLVLPVIAIEFVWAEKIAEDATIGLATQLAGAAIWLAFAVEFLVLISIVQDRLLFVRRHWLDLVIICLPLVAFLRVLRIGRLGRLLRLNQLTKVSRTARAFRMKGLAIRVWRALLLLEIIDRIMHRNDEQRLEKLQQKLAEAEKEVQSLRQEIEVLESRMLDSDPAQEVIPS